MKCSASHGRAVTALAMLIALGAQAIGGGAAYVRRQEDGIALGNEFLELVLRTGDGRCAARQLVNKLARREIRIRGDDFSIGVEGRPPLRAADFAFKEAVERAIPGGRRLTLSHESAAAKARVDVVYELGDRAFFVRRRLELSASQPLPLRQVDVWLAKVGGEAPHQGFGEPVFLEDTFWALEFPGGHNHYAEGMVRLSHYPGRTTNRFVSKTAVVGVAEPGRMARRFRQYVEAFQATPEAARLFVNYNTWWTLMPPTEKNCLALIDVFKKKLFDPHGESFDTFTIDDGWDDKTTLWKIRPDRFPRGFAPLLAPLEAMKANLGLWLSPSSGYGHAPHLAAQGYEHNSNKWYCCQSGAKYRRDIAKVVTGLAKTYDMAFFKFDGFCASCEAKGHGHLPGPYAREANIDAYIELLSAVRKTRPGVYLDPTCGMWLSPWWLRHVDSIWGSVSGDYPSIVVPAPIIRDSATTTRDAIFRQRRREHPGYPPSAIEHLGIIVITPEKWEDNAMAVVGRGARLLTLYINPKFFQKGERDWAFLASLLKWARHNAATLGHTTLIGGDPFKREPYGFAHFSGRRGILCLRNPFIEPTTLKLKLDESVGWSRPQDKGFFAARIVYPREEVLNALLRHGETLEAKLGAYETMIIHLEQTTPGEHQHLKGIRAHETERAGNRVSYVVYARPGHKLSASTQAPLRRATLDGQEVPIIGAGGVGLAIAFAGDEQECSVRDVRLAPREREARWQIDGTCNVNVPTGTKAAAHVLCVPRGGSAGTLECTAQVNGKPAKVRAVRRPGRRQQAHGAHAWTWFEFPIPEGRSQVAVSIKPSEDNRFFRGEVGWWLWAEHRLKKHTLTLEFPKPLPPAKPQPLPLPLNMDSEREIITIQAPKLFRAGTRWPKLDKATVYLDEVAPDEVAQGWGKLERNRSVWGKPMIIAGQKFARGLGTHASARLVYELAGGKFKSFRCLVGRDEHAMDGRVAFQVRVDGKMVFDSGPMSKTSAPKTVEVDVRGAAILELLTLDGGDGISGDHGNWADPRLLR